MRKTFASLIESSIEDQDLAQQARIFHRLLLTSGALLCIAAIITIALFAIEPASYGLGPTSVVLLVMLTTAASYTWSRRGHVHAAVYFFLVGAIVATSITLLMDGMPSASIMVYAFAIVAAGLLIRPSSALIFALLNTALYAGISAWHLLEPPPAPYGPTEHFVYNVIAVTIAGLVLAAITWLVARSLQSSLKSLRESEGRYRTLFEQAYDAIFIERIEDDAIIDANRRACELHGYTRQELLGMKVPDLQAPEFRGQVGSVLKDELARHEGGTFEAMNIHRDGTRIPIEVSTSRMTGTGGELALSIVRDVTERARLEEENEGRRLYLESVLDSANDAIVTMGDQGLVLEWNSGAERLFGYPAAEAIGQKLDSLVTGNNVEAYKEAAGYTQVALAGERIPPSEVTRYRADGTPLQVILSASPILIKEQMIGAMAVYTDITERVQVEKERSRLLVQIQEQARQIQQVMNTVPEGVLLLDPTGRVMLANPLAERELSTLANAGVGDTLTQLGGRPLAELLAPAPDGPRHELKVDSPQARIFELSARPTNFWPDRTLSAKESEGWVLVIRDVTQEREIEQRVQQQERLAAVGQLAAGIAHDFNNILAVIVLYTQMGLRTPDLSQDLRHRLETVERQARRATDLIQQILDFSRKAVLEQQPLDLKLFMKEQVKLLQRTVPENIQIELTHGADEYTVNADPTRMQQVIVNLAVNARDAMPDGGKLDIALTRTSYSDGIMCTTCAQIKGGEWVKLTVSDNGIGIPADVLPHIFEPFFTTKEVGKGTGLGLAQVFGTVKQHEGHLEVTSTVGEGTSFAIHLPALLLTEPKTLIQDKPGLIHGRGETILLVEDNPVMLQAMLVSLESLNYQVLRASSGREALAIFAQHRKEIDLVLSDLVMPEIGGMELFQALKMREPAIKMILISGYPLHQEIEDLQAQGITNWLQKPVNLDHLAQVIARALD